jgi:methanethiol S-methyltransferase
MMFTNHLILATLWVLYAFFHSILAHDKVKDGFKKLLGYYFKYYRLAYTIFALVTLLFVCWFQLSIQSPLLYQTNNTTLAVGIFFSASGFALMIICIKKYFIGLSGVQSISNTITDKKLIITGVHRFVRHPLYLGTFVFLWGLFILYPFCHLLISNVIITVYTIIGTRFEERKLLRNFGQQYKEYQQNVKAFIPGFY